jgi:Flp pilus assembly protein TadD
VLAPSAFASEPAVVGRAAGWSFVANDAAPAVLVNAMLRAVGDRPVVLVGSDVVVTPGWLSRISAALHADPSIAVAGPVVLGSSGPQAPLPSDAGATAPRDANYLGTCCLVFDRAACRGVGMLRTDVSLAMSLWDYFLRIASSGKRAVVVPSVVVERASSVIDADGASYEELAPRESALDERLAQAARQTDPGRAFDAYRAIAAEFEQARAHQALGLAHLADGNPAEAVRELTTATSRSPADGRIYNHLGYALTQKGDLFGAEQSFRAAIQLMPELVDPLLNLIELCRRRRMYDDAVKYANRLAAIAPGHPDALAAIAVLALETGDRQNAPSLLDALRRINPEHPVLQALAAESEREPVAVAG